MTNIEESMCHKTIQESEHWRFENPYLALHDQSREVNVP